MRPKRARPAATADDSDCPAPKRPAETPPEQGLAPRAPAAAPPPAQNPTPNSPPATTIEIISQSDGDSDVAPFPGDVGGGSDSDGSGALEAGAAAEGSGGSAKPAVEPNGPAIELGDASLDLEAARASLRKIHATLSRGAAAKASTPGDDDEAPIDITDAQADLVFRVSNDEGEFDVLGYGKKATKRQDGRAARPPVMLLRAEIVRRGCRRNGVLCKPRGWKYEDCVICLASCSRGFDWTDPSADLVGRPAEASTRMSANNEGARAINYIAANAEAYRKSKGVDSRQELDAKMAKTRIERESDSFWAACAEAVLSKGANPEIDELQAHGDGMYFGSVDPSLPEGGCCPALDTNTCAIKLKAMLKVVSNQVTQAMTNMQQSGEGDLATVVELALDGAGDFPDAGEGAERVSGSSPYDFLATGIASYYYAVLRRDGLLLASTNMLSPAAQSSSSSGSATSMKKRKTPIKKQPERRVLPTPPGPPGEYASSSSEFDEPGDAGLAAVSTLVAESRAANMNFSKLAAAFGPAARSTSGSLETEQVTDAKNARFETLLNELGELAEASTFKPARAKFKVKQVYDAGAAIDTTGLEIIEIIAEALGDHVGDLEGALRALAPAAAEAVFG